MKLLSDEERKTLHDQAHASLRRRVEQLQRLLDMNAPDVIVTDVVYMVFQAAFMVSPDVMGAHLAHHFEKLLRNNYGFCVNVDCGTELSPPPHPVECAGCEKKGEEFVKDLKLDEEADESGSDDGETKN